MKHDIFKELKCLEEANYQSLDEKRLVIDAYLANKIQELFDRFEERPIVGVSKPNEKVYFSRLDDPSQKFRLVPRCPRLCQIHCQQDQTLQDNEDVRDKDVKPNKQDQEK